jgi:uncharacterized repeat protein (TIGR03803 family)
MKSKRIIALSRVRRFRIGTALILTTFMLALTAATTVASAQTFTTLHNFDSADGANPYAALIQATNGDLYGTTMNGGANGGGTVFRVAATGALKTLYSFCSLSGCTDGSNSWAALIQPANGNFYGTTYAGGTNGSGTVFKVTPSGTLTTLHSFCSQSGCADGADPTSALIQATDGNLYGTDEIGRAHV